MRKLLLTILLCVLTSNIFAQTSIIATFDERCDLMAVVCRLAGRPEYNNVLIKEFSDKTDAYFADYKEHEAVKFATDRFGFDRAMTFALYLKWNEDGTLSLNKDLVYDRGEDIAALNGFVMQLNDFIKVTDFHKFYQSNAELYKQAADYLQLMLKDIHFEWFDSFFTPSKKESEKTSFKMILSVLNGVDCYGPKTVTKDGNSTMFSIISCWQLDEDGKPYLEPETMMPLIIHEFCHSFCNPLDAKFWKKTEKGANNVYSVAKSEMEKQHYGRPEIMMNETFVRASVICYMRNYYQGADIEYFIQDEELKGFILVRDYYNALTEWEKTRKPATMQKFMPELLKIVNNFSIEEYEAEQQKWLEECADITCNIKDGQIDFPSGNQQIIITFSKKMRGGLALYVGELGADSFPPIVRNPGLSFSWSEDYKTVTVDVILEPEKTYSFSIHGKEFKTEDGHTGKENVNIKFTTK